MAEAVHMHQCVQFFGPLFCPQHKIIHVGFESADQSTKYIRSRSGITGANESLGLRHQVQSMLLFLLRKTMRCQLEFCVCKFLIFYLLLSLQSFKYFRFHLWEK